MARSLPGPLKPDRAFLVQLRQEAGGRRRLSGRVEHVMTGASEQFGSLAALLDFMARFTAPATTRFAAPAPTRFAAPAPVRFTAPAPVRFAAPAATPARKRKEER